MKASKLIHGDMFTIDGDEFEYEFHHFDDSNNAVAYGPEHMRQCDRGHEESYLLS